MLISYRIKILNDKFLRTKDRLNGLFNLEGCQRVPYYIYLSTAQHHLYLNFVKVFSLIERKTDNE